MTFNLIDEPWILVQSKQGPATVSLRQAFAQADTIIQLTGEVPTQAFANLRLMLAICHDALELLGPEDVETLRDEGVDLVAIDTYLDEVHDRFELFDDTCPFMQVPDLHTAKNEHSGLEKIIADIPNGVPFFTTRAGAQLETISAAEAARWLVHVQAFDPSGIRSGAVGDPLQKGGKGYPIGPGWAGQIGGVVIHGSCLAETLALNLTPRSEHPADRPIWRKPPLTAERDDDAVSHGPVETLTWPSRRVRLVGGVDGVVGVVLCQGDKLAPQRMEGLEPMTAWRYSKPQSAKFGRPVYMPKELDPARSLWRGLPELVRSGQTATIEDQGSKFDATIPPATLAATISDEVSTMLVIQTIGMQYGPQNAVTEEIIDDRIEVHASLLSPDAVAAHVALADGVAIAEEAVRALGQFAAHLARAAGEKGDSAGEGARQRAVETAWSRLDGPARRWVRSLSADTDLLESRTAWSGEVLTIVEDLGTTMVDAASPAAMRGRETSFGFMSAHKAYAMFRAALRKHAGLPKTNGEGKE